jgi:hypothetical protein
MTLQDIISYHFSLYIQGRRGYLALVGLVLVSAVLGVIIYSAVNVLTADQSQIPQKTAFGFTTHIRATKDDKENHTLAQFKKNVDLLSAYKQQWIRLPIVDREIAPSGTADKIKWNQENLKTYDAAITYANEKGLQVMLTTNVPSYGSEYQLDEYKKLTKNYYTFLAKRYKGKVAVWQLFNEPNVHSFRNHKLDPKLLDDAQYVAELEAILQVADESINKIDKKAKTTTSVSHWIGAQTGDEFLIKSTRLFDRVGEPLDAVTLNVFPDRNLEEISRLPEYVEYFEKRYDKEVIIGEVGVSTKKNAGFSESDQAIYMTLAVSTMRNAEYHPSVLFYYELMDENLYTDTLDHENFYGVLYADGKKKSSFDLIIASMQPEK